MAYIDTGAYDRWRKQQELLAQNDSYNAQKQAIDNKYNGGLGGFLGGLIGNIGKGIGDIGYSLGGMFGTAGASLKDIFEGKAGTMENQLAFKRNYYGAKDDKDAALKAAGNALNAATNLATTVVPGVGGGGAVAKALGGTLANTAAGAIGGVADEFAQQGSDARLDSAVNRALSGAAAGAVTGKLGSKIGNAKSNIGKTLLNNKFATSAIGRGALSGAVGGATGAGTSAALGGGDVLGSALEGARSGAIAGGVQSGLMNAAKSVGDATIGRSVRSRFDKQREKLSKQKDAEAKSLAKVKTSTLNNIMGAKDDDAFNDAFLAATGKKPNYDMVEGAKDRRIDFETQPDTVLVDDNGNPIVMYHSSDADFDKFDDAMLGNSTDAPNTAFGHFVTPEKDFSKRFGKNTKEYYANVKKPITHPYGAEIKYPDSKQLDKIVSDYLNATNNSEVLDSWKQMVADGDYKNLYDAYMNSLFFDGTDPYEFSADEKPLLREKGYDAVEIIEGPRDRVIEGIENDETPVVSYAVFDPNALVRTDSVKTAPVQQPAAPAQPTPAETLPDYTTPTDYQGNQLKIRNKNIVEKAGSILSNAGEAIKNSDIYNSLYSKTANRVTRNDSINKLRKLGFEPADYAEAAKISTTTNKFVDDIVKNSGAKVTDQNFAEKVLTPDDSIIISDPAYQKRYDTKVRALLNRIETGDYPGQYNAADLLKESRQFGEWASDLRKKSVNVNGDVTNRDGYELAEAFTDVKYALRDLASQAVDGFGDKYTKSQLAERLKKLGAPQKAIDYMLDAKDIGGFIRNTSLFEDARQMSREMAETKIRRNANAGTSTKPGTMVLNASGIPQLAGAIATPLGRISGGIAKGVGDIAQSIGSRLPEGGASNLSPQLQAILGNYLGRSEGQAQASNMVQNARKAEEYGNLQNMLSSIQAGEQELANAGSTPTIQDMGMQSELGRIASAMDRALAAGDLTSYNKLVSLYKTAYQMYNLRNPQQTLTQTEKTRQAKFQNADSALGQLETLFSNAGGAQGNIRGGVASWLGSLGMNDDLNTYNDAAKSLVNQISGAVGAIDKNLIPQITDSEEEAQRKLSELRRLIEQSKTSYSNAYGW